MLKTEIERESTGRIVERELYLVEGEVRESTLFEVLDAQRRIKLVSRWWHKGRISYEEFYAKKGLPERCVWYNSVGKNVCTIDYSFEFDFQGRISSASRCWKFAHRRSFDNSFVVNRNIYQATWSSLLSGKRYSSNVVTIVKQGTDRVEQYETSDNQNDIEVVIASIDDPIEARLIEDALNYR